MAMAIMVSTRLWLGGVVSEHRDRKRADHLLGMVKACGGPLCARLIVTDGWASYPNSLRRAFREKVKRLGQRGRCHVAGMARDRAWHRHQENRQKARGRSDPTDDARNP